MSKIIIAGGVTYDSIIRMESFPLNKPQTVFSSDFHETVGGTGAGKALAASKIFDNTTLHYMAGDDREGDIIKKYLKEHDIILLTDPDPKGTERHINLMNDKGERISIYVKYSTFEPLISKTQFLNECKDADFVVLNIINYCRYFINDLKKMGKEIWCDIHDYDEKNPYHNDFINAADYIFMSSDQIKDYKKFMKELIKNGKKLVVCTHGRNGSTFLSSNEDFIDLDIVDDYPHVDTNGAGDNFMVGFIYGISKGLSFEMCQKYATITAGLCISSKELVSERLSRDIIEEEFKKYYC